MRYLRVRCQIKKKKSKATNEFVHEELRKGSTDSLLEKAPSGQGVTNPKLDNENLQGQGNQPRAGPKL